jgi:hypothetical protein
MLSEYWQSFYLYFKVVRTLYCLCYVQVNAAHLLLVLTEERCQVPAVLQTIPVARLWQEDWQQRLEHWAMCIKGDVTVQTLFKQIGRDIRRDSHQILALK